MKLENGLEGLLRVGILALWTSLVFAVAYDRGAEAVRRELAPILRSVNAARDPDPCIENLKVIENAKDGWAQANRKGPADRPSMQQLLKFMKSSTPVCPTGGTYTIGDMSTRVSCSKASEGHVLP